MTDVKGRSPRDPNPWYRGSKRFGDLGRHAPPGDDLENTRDHERIWHELGLVKGRGGDAGPIDWVTPTLINSWKNAGPPFDDVAYGWDGPSLIFKGHISGGLSGTVAFVLDTAHRPDKDLSTITDVVMGASPGAAQIYVAASDGSVKVTMEVSGPAGPPGHPDVVGGGAPFLMGVMGDVLSVNTTSTSFVTRGGSETSRTSSDWREIDALGGVLQVRLIAWLQSGTLGARTTLRTQLEAMNIGDNVSALVASGYFAEIWTENDFQTLCDSGWVDPPAMPLRDNIAMGNYWLLKTSVGSSTAQLYRPQLLGRWILP